MVTTLLYLLVGIVGIAIGLGTVEFFLVGFLAPSHRHGQHVLAEVGVDVQHLLGEIPGFLRGVAGSGFRPLPNIPHCCLP